MYVCMHVCMYVCMYVNIYGYMDRGRGEGEEEGERLLEVCHQRKESVSRSLPLLCMWLHLALIAITTCIFFGLLEVCLQSCRMNAKHVYSITSHLSFRM